MQTMGNKKHCLMVMVREGESIVAFACAALLTACATEQPQWLDHTALVLRPSHHQAMVAFSFGAEAPPEPGARLAPRNVSAVIAGAVVVQDDPVPKLETVDFKGGRLFIHSPRTR